MMALRFGADEYEERPSKQVEYSTNPLKIGANRGLEFIAGGLLILIGIPMAIYQFGKDQIGGRNKYNAKEKK